MDNKNKIREYQIINKDKYDAYKKKYRENNKNKINEKLTCECGSIYSRSHKSHHYKTNKHLEFINKQNI